MAPDTKLKAFTARVLDGPPPLAFVKWIIACQEKNIDRVGKMFFTIDNGIERGYRIRMVSTGIHSNMYNDELKIFGFIREANSESTECTPEIERMAIGSKACIARMDLDKMIVMAYHPRARTGRIYGPISKLNITAFLCQIINTNIDAQLISGEEKTIILS